MTSDDNISNEDIKPPEPVPPEAPDAEVTPGQLLSRKREALGLSIQQVADELHITMHYVRALEADAHEKLPGVVFIRGYIRAYANYLKLDPTVLVNVFNEYINQRENSEQEASYTRSRRRRDRNLPWIAVSGVAFVLIAVALWYFGTGAAPQTGSAATPAPAGAQATPSTTTAGAGSTTPSLANVATTRSTGVEIQPAPSAAVTAPASVDVSPAATGGFASSVPQSFAAPVTTLVAPTAAPGPAVSVTEPAPAATATTPAGTAITSTTTTTAPSTQADTAPVSPETQPLNSTNESAPVAPPAATPSATPTVPSAAVPAQGAGTQLISVDAGGPDVVEIVFSGESLVQIDDGTARQIYRDIRLAGDRLQVNGTGPFNVLLGDASSAELHLNGKKIEFTESIRIDNSARLTIGL